MHLYCAECTECWANYELLSNLTIHKICWKSWVQQFSIYVHTHPLSVYTKLTPAASSWTPKFYLLTMSIRVPFIRDFFVSPSACTSTMSHYNQQQTDTNNNNSKVIWEKAESLLISIRQVEATEFWLQGLTPIFPSLEARTPSITICH